MEVLDLKKIVREADLDSVEKDELARHLFPSNTYYRRAYERAVAGTTDLNAIQISKLAVYLGVSISALFEQDYTELNNRSNPTEWKIDAQGYTAYLDTKSFKLRVLDKRSLIHEESILRQSIPLRTLTSKIRKIVESKNRIKNAK